MSAIELELSKLRLDGGTQSRAAFDWVTVADYAESMKEGAQFPAIVVFFDGTEYWVADGFHRVEARLAAGLPSILSDVRQGTVREAVLFSVGANTDHGLRRTQADKRRSVMRLFDDDEWRQWADREIARRCGVSHVFVSKLRQEVFGSSQEDIFLQRKYVRNGQEHSMNTRNIGAGADDSPASAQLGFDSVPGFQSDQAQAESPAQTGATGNVTSSPFWFDTPAGWREGWGPIVDTTGVGTWFSSKHVSLPLRISNYRNFWLFAIDGSEEFSSSRFSIPSNFEAEGFLHPGDAAQAAENAWSDLQHIARFQAQAKHGEPAQAGTGATGNVTSEDKPVDYSRPAGWREGWGAVTYSADRERQGLMPWHCKHDFLPMEISGLTSDGKWSYSVRFMTRAIADSALSLEEAAGFAAWYYAAMELDAEKKADESPQPLDFDEWCEANQEDLTCEWHESGAEYELDTRSDAGRDLWYEKRYNAYLFSFNTASSCPDESCAVDGSEGEYQAPEIERLDLLTRISELEEQNAELMQAESERVDLLSQLEELREYSARQAAEIAQLKASAGAVSVSSALLDFVTAWRSNLSVHFSKSRRDRGAARIACDMFEALETLLGIGGVHVEQP